MKIAMFAIAYKWENDVFYDFAKEEKSYDLEFSSLLPTEALAQEIIEDELGEDFVPVKVTIHDVDARGGFTYSHEDPKEWTMEEIQ